jgi:hypothetical protein
MEFTTKHGQRIVCDSLEAFLEIRAKYFPEIPPLQWEIKGISNQVQRMILNTTLLRLLGRKRHGAQ